MLSQVQQGVAYPLGTLIDLLAGFLSIVTVYYLWRAVFRAQPQIAGFGWPEIQAYVLLSNAIFTLLAATTTREMMGAIRTGAIVVDLVRPYSYLGAQFALALGRALTVGALGGALTVLLGALVVGMAAPASPLAAGIFLLSISLSFLLSFLLNYLLALLCLWTKDSEGLLWAYGILSYIFSGGMLPLAFLPAWLQAVASALPFKGLIDTPLQVYRGALLGWGLAVALGLQALWVGLLAALARWVWRQGLRAAEQQGG